MISRLFYPGQDVGVTSIVPLYTRLFRKGMTLTPHTELVAVEGSTVLVANAFTGAQRPSTAWTPSSCRWAVARPTRSPVRSGIAARHAIGDCVAPRGIHQATIEGTHVARAI